MSVKLVQRAIVVALVCATVVAAAVAFLVPRHGLDSRRSDRVVEARHRIGDALRRRAYYLEDVADMVGVHDDADVEEFSRYARVRGRYEQAVVSVQWIRRSPDGRLEPPRDVGPEPVLAAPGRENDTLANATAQGAAARAIALASLGKRVAISTPVRLANGDAAFYLAVPVQARRFSGLLSNAESRSAVVGLVDAQALVAQELSTRPLTALRLRDEVTPLASIGSGLHNAVRVIVPAAGRRWTISVDGGSLSSLQRALPWVILALGLGLALTVALVLRSSARRQEAALRLARERSTELAHSTAMIQRVTGAIDECFYTYTLDDGDRVRTRFATPGWSRVLGLADETGDAAAAWQLAILPADAGAHAAARERLREGEPTDLEFRVLDTDGTVHWLWAREHPIGAAVGEVVVDGVISEITVRKAAESELERAHAEAERLSRMDALTDVFNRRHFSEVLVEELARPERRALTVLLLDLDDFKRINDEHGHLIGDTVLRAAARRFASTVRDTDCLARWGGEEFAILAPATDRAGAIRLAERARRALAEDPVRVEGVAIELTASVGVAVAADDLHAPDAVVDAADRALYEAKRAGRNAVRVCDPAAQGKSKDWSLLR